MCWSVGQADVDCPTPNGHGYGLCCFDGCTNSCRYKAKALGNVFIQANDVPLIYIKQKLCIHTSNWRPHNIVILVRKPYERKPYEPTHKVAHPPSIPTPHPIHAPPTEPIHLVTPVIYSQSKSKSNCYKKHRAIVILNCYKYFCLQRFIQDYKPAPTPVAPLDSHHSQEFASGAYHYGYK